MTIGNQIIDPIIRELMESAAIGEAARMFLDSALGRHVANRAADDVEEAIAELCDVDPYDGKAVSALQVRINVAKQAMVYLKEAMTNGEHALKQLEDES